MKYLLDTNICIDFNPAKVTYFDQTLSCMYTG